MNISHIGRRACAVACAAAMATAGGLTATAVAATGGSPAIGTGPTHSTSTTAVPENAHVVTGKLPGLGATGTAFPSSGTSAKSSTGGAQPQVAGGNPVDSSAYPGVVGITTYSWLNVGDPELFESVCTGTVLSATKVLTAANCVDSQPDSATFVVAGRDDVNDSSSGFVAQAGSIWTDPSYTVLDARLASGAPANNLAVITLDTALPAAYPPIALTAQGDSSPYAAGTAATTVGYGDSGVGPWGVLYAGTVQVQSDATCTASAAAGGNPYDTSTSTCAGWPGSTPEACVGDQGGPLLENSVEVGITNITYGTLLPPSSCALARHLPIYEKASAYNTEIAAGAALTPAEDLGFSGSGHADMLAVDSLGNLDLYSGSGYLQQGASFPTSFAGSTPIGSGWTAMKDVLRVTDWDGIGTESVLAVDQNGNLYEYSADGKGTFLNDGHGKLIGTGFASFTQLVGADNFTGDGKPDLIGVAPNGNLDLYEGNEAGGWSNTVAIVIGSGWSRFTQLVSAGDWNKDGHQALIGADSSGGLWEYESTGVGTWTAPGGEGIGTAFNNFSKLISVGDWNGDQAPDLIGVTPSGLMYLYETDGKGDWTTGTGIQIGTGFTFPKIF